MSADTLQIILGIAGFVVLGWFIKVLASGTDERKDEDDARRYFDRHGHWPDEQPPARP